MPSLPVEMYRDKLARGLYLDESQRHSHRNGLDKGIVKQVVRAFANPRYVFDSSSVPGALVSVYDVRDREGKPVMASLVSAAKANRIEVNLVTSIYGKTEKRLQEWVDEGLLRYVDDTEKPEGILRLQLPPARPSASSPNILRKSRIVNETSPASQSSDPLMIREPENDGPNMEDVSSNGGILFEPTDEERKRYTDDWRADVRKAVEEHYLVPDVVLEKFRGEDWADREMRFRAALMLPENQWWFEAATAADDFDAFVDALNGQRRQDSLEPFDIDVKGHTGEDYDWARRLWDYAHLEPPVQKDREFVKNMTADRSSMVSCAKALRGYLVPQLIRTKKNGTNIYGQRYVYNSWPGVSTKVSRLTYSSTEEEVEAAKDLVRANPHPYRRAFDYSVRQTQEAKETAAGGAANSYGLEDYLEEVGDNALDAWRSVERDAAKRELQQLREEKRNKRLKDLGVTEKTAGGLAGDDVLSRDARDATVAKEAAQEGAVVREASSAGKKVAKAKAETKALGKELEEARHELEVAGDEYADLLKSLGAADREADDKAAFLNAYGKEKARQADELRTTLPNGMVLQWGTVSGMTGNVTLPVAFSNTSYSIVATTSGTSRASSELGAITYPVSAGAFYIDTNCGYSSKHTARWVAVGY